MEPGRLICELPWDTASDNGAIVNYLTANLNCSFLKYKLHVLEEIH